MGVFFAAEDATAGFEVEERGDRVAIQSDVRGREKGGGFREGFKKNG
jgi:hypothetical protein